jgi:NADH-quinone oxidoreductase subunit N
MWAPDVYEGSPTPIAGFMAAGVKAAAFLALLRIVVVALASPEGGAEPMWVSLLSGLAMVTIVVGNALALVQQSIKRMLAYSSVSHAGYALIGVVAAALGEPGAGKAVLFYLTAYTFMTLGAFGVLSFLERGDSRVESERFGAYAGIGYKHPALSAAMALFMIALAGLPPTGGFFGKLYVFSSAIRADQVSLALVGIFGSIVSVYYYLRVIVAFYMRDVPDPGPTPTATRSPDLTLGLVLSTAAVLLLGVAPGRWLVVTEAALKSLGY